jgi:uncharacterized protein YbbK (DUF523 family)
MPEIVLVSACLLGLPTRYDGNAKTNEEVLASLSGKVAVPVCPEQLGGLPTPRSPHAIDGGSGEEVLAGRAHLLSPDGGDATEEFLRGARLAARIAEITGAGEAWLKEGSPSCGVRCTTSSDGRVTGPGVTSALLRSRGIKIVGYE